MEDSQANNTADELEVVEMLRVDAGVRVDLEGVVVMRRIFEQSVVCVRTYVFCPVYADTDFPLSRDRARMLSIENIGRCVSVLTCGVVVRNGARRARSIV